MEVNVKTGLYPFGGFSYGAEADSDIYVKSTFDLKISFSFRAEYLYPLNDIFKVGAGLEYASG